MSETPVLGILETLRLEKTRLAEQQAAIDRRHAEIDREMADIERLAAVAAQFNLDLVPKPGTAATAPLDTLGDLIQIYLTVENSPFRKLTHSSKRHYETLLGLIREEHGAELLANLTKEDFEAWYEKWSEGGKQSSGHAKISMVRNILGFGTSAMNDAKCLPLSGILSKLRYKAPKGRTEKLTKVQADQIRLMAQSVKRPSIALAQAFQFDVDLLQKDVIGEWVPLSEKGFSDITTEDMKWVRGLRWNEIDDDFILHHPSDSWQGDVERDLKEYPMVMDEFRKLGLNTERPLRSQLPASGAIIVSDRDRLPWDAVEFRRQWRKLADACGIPKTVRNADSRARAKDTASVA
jgi:hypothetical protein